MKKRILKKLAALVMVLWTILAVIDWAQRSCGGTELKGVAEILYLIATAVVGISAMSFGAVVCLLYLLGVLGKE